MAETISNTTYTSQLTLGSGSNPLLITNTGAVEIAGKQVAIAGPSYQTFTISNAGTISGGSGISLLDGGSIGNTGLIEGGYNGIDGGYYGITMGGRFSGGGTVNNTGTITSSVFGVALFDGGTIVNQAGGVVNGTTADGVLIGNYAGMVVNAGVISSAATAVALFDGGSIDNAAGGVFIGSEVGAYLYGAGTVTNAGTIIGGTDAVEFANSSNHSFTDRLIIDPGAVFQGAVVGGGSNANSIELAAGGGTVAGFGSQFVGFPNVVLDSGSDWRLDGTFATADTITLLGNGDVLAIDGISNLAATLAGFVAGDTIDLSVVVANQTSLAGSTLELLEDGVQVGSLLLTGAETSQTYSAVTNGTGGTDLVACFAIGTHILTPEGERAIETLGIGDLVCTAAGAIRPIMWIGRRDYGDRFVAGRADIMPVRIAPGALADGVPARCLDVSPKHAMFVGGALVSAELLINGASIRQIEVDQVHYLHIELEEHDILVAEGAPSESFVDRGSRRMFQNAHEFFALHGEVPPRPDCAPRLEHGTALATIRRQVASRAGLDADHVADAIAPGPLDGRIDVAEHTLISGWVFDGARSHTSVAIEVLVDGRRVACCVANRYRADLRQAEKADGRCAFACRLPEPLSADVDHSIQVRRLSDGAVLPKAAIVPADATSPGPLDGYIDAIAAGKVKGWALDLVCSDRPVRLEVLAGDRVLGQVVANRYRPDLRQAGKAGGWCSFEFDCPTLDAPYDPGQIQVRRAQDGARLPAAIERHVAA